MSQIKELRAGLPAESGWRIALILFGMVRSIIIYRNLKMFKDQKVTK